jgi:hypothetical protein
MGRFAALGLFLLVAAPSAFGQDRTNSAACFQAQTAALRLAQLDDAISRCTIIIDDRATPASLRGEALSQRGVMHGRRWSIVEIAQDAVQGIADITEGFRLHTPKEERRRQLVLVRAQLYAATGQTRRAGEDFRDVLAGDPTNDIARAGLRRLGEPGL